MLLDSLQRTLEDLYDLPVECTVEDFLFSDRDLLPVELRHRLIDEQVLIADADTPAIGVFLDGALLQRLEANSPLVSLTHTNLADTWAALEAVSHFRCLAYAAAADRGVSLLELELQAEIDKFLLSAELLRAQTRRAPVELYSLLFARTRIEPAICPGKYDLYVRAHQYAARFCAALGRSYRAFTVSVPASLWAEGQVLAELRRFYRLTASAKISFIDRHC